MGNNVTKRSDHKTKFSILPIMRITYQPKTNPNTKLVEQKIKTRKTTSQQISTATKDSPLRAKKRNSSDLNCPRGAILY